MADQAGQPLKASQQQFGDTTVNDSSLLFQGIVHGDVHLNQRPVTPPSPTAIIPFGRDPDFVERKEIDRVHELCAKPASQTALLGLGGVGKSQIAIEYAYRVREQSPGTWVFWIHASNAARYEQSFRDVAEYLKIPGRRNSQSNIFELLSHWLREDKRGRWVVILDNLDEAGFFFDVSNVGSDGQAQNQGRSTPLRSYLPCCQHGAVLITTRSRDVAFRLVEECNIVMVEPMNTTDALSLAEKKLGGPVKQTDIESTQALIKALEYMPLAIAQATAYIGHKKPRCSIKQYLEKFEQSDRKKVGLLDYDRGQLRRDREAKNSIITTWQISFDHIRESRQSATDLLSIMSFCDRQGIPESLLRASNYEDTATGSAQQSIGTTDSKDEAHVYEKESSDDESNSNFSAAEAFEQDLSTLLDYSFISTSDSGRFQMHRLVQLATRKWLQAKGQEDRWKHEFINRLASQFPTGEYENWPKCQELLPHVTSAAAQRPKTEDSVAAWSDILHRAAWYFCKKGQGPEAQKMAENAMEARSKRLGATHDDTLSSVDMVGHALMIQGWWKAAEKLFVEVMETRKQKLGLYHPDTLTSMANLATTYWNQGRWDKAEELEVEVMETSKQKLGLDHPDTLFSTANLASTYHNQGRWDKAEELEVEVMETSKQKLGLDHPDTLTSMANLASTYRNQGRWDKAKELEVEVMETSKQKLGLDHPDTLTSIANLASTYRNQGRWDKAEELEVEVMETRKQKLGLNHPSTLTAMNNLAATYLNQGRWDKAEELFVEVMETRKQKLGLDHPDTLTSIANLAATYRNQGRWDKAEELEVEVIETRKQKLGLDHPHTLASIANLASTYWSQGRWDKAEELFIKVIETSKQKLGLNHPSTLTAMNNLAHTWYAQERAVEAIDMMDSCYRLRLKALGQDHPHTSSSLQFLTIWRAEF